VEIRIHLALMLMKKARDMMLLILDRCWISLLPIFLLGTAAFADERVKAPTIIPEVNAIVEQQLHSGLEKYRAKAAAALIMNAKTGEVIASVSVHKDSGDKSDLIVNNLYEFGSSAKITTVAAGLESKKISMNSRIDARNSLRIGRYKINDYHAQRRILTVPEIVLYSSNIGAARISLRFGEQYQSLFFRSLGLRDAIENGPNPVFSKEYSRFTTATNSFGHGFAITPLHAASVFASLSSIEGRVVRPSFTKRESQPGFSIVSPAVTAKIRKMLRLNVEIGAAKAVNIRGLWVGAMTATAEKVEGDKYSEHLTITSMVAVAPYQDPQFVFLTLFDEPQGLESDGGYKTAAWNAGSVTAEIIEATAARIGLQRLQ
jgi:cell division protein FtsI (penicillin-binding protein 3)